jgi:hypothetical protein
VLHISLIKNKKIVDRAAHHPLHILMVDFDDDDE